MKGTVEGLFAWSTGKRYGMPECCFVSACSSFSLHSLLCISPFSLPFLFLTLESYSLVPFLLACLLRFISLRNSWVLHNLDDTFAFVCLEFALGKGYTHDAVDSLWGRFCEYSTLPLEASSAFFFPFLPLLPTLSEGYNTLLFPAHVYPVSDTAQELKDILGRAQDLFGEPPVGWICYALDQKPEPCSEVFSQV